MDTPLTLDEIRAAVGDLTAAFLHHRPLTDWQWDRAIATLLVAREQHGGRIRRLIHTIFDAGRHDGPVDALPDALTELHCHLAIADNPPPPIPPPPHPSTRRRRPTRRRPDSHRQLSLFTPATPGSNPTARAGDRPGTSGPISTADGRAAPDVTTSEDHRPA